MIHHLLKHAKHAKKYATNYYSSNPHKLSEHGQHAVRIGALIWTRKHSIAKHTTGFLKNAAAKGFTLFKT